MPYLTFCKCCARTISSEAETCVHCGQPNPQDESKSRLIVLARQTGNKIAAIKLIRESNPSLDLKEAKDFCRFILGLKSELAAASQRFAAS